MTDPKPLLPVPEDAPEYDGKPFNPNRDKIVDYTRAKMVFPYKDKYGRILGYVVRLDIDGEKITPTVTYCTHDDGSEKWTVKAFPAPRPLYGLDRVEGNNPVLIVEGEKAADAARKAMPDVAVLAWPMGGNSYDKANWRSIFSPERTVIIWPDNDDPGFKVADDLALLLCAHVKQVTILKPHAEAKRKDDAADFPNPAQMRAWLNTQLQDHAFKILTPGDAPKRKKKAPGIDGPPPEFDSIGPTTEWPELPPPDDTDDGPQFSAVDQSALPFQILGHNDGHVFIYPKGAKQVLTHKISMLGKGFFIAVCPDLSFWADKFPAKNGVEWDNASAWVATAAYIVGVYDPNRLRGRGAWLDDGRPVLHLGDRLFADGIERDLYGFGSANIYVNSPAWSGVYVGKPASDREAIKLNEITTALSWSTNASGPILSGWLVFAMICGAFSWRPHIWITGPAGSGKTTVQRDIVNRFLGEMAVAFEGNTTESGIRQTLMNDARPVTFDEAEAADEKSGARIQSILSTVRTASTDSGGTTAKGSASHTAKNFKIRAAFCLSSINQSTIQLSDAQRFFSLVLKKTAPEPEKFKALLAKINEVITDDFRAAILGRTLKLLPVIRKNQEAFSAAAIQLLGDQRMGDMIGPVMACNLSLLHDRTITVEQAGDIIKKYDWTDRLATEEAPDHARLLERVLSHQISFDSPNRPRQSTTIGELIDVMVEPKNESTIPQESALAALKMYGIKPEFVEGIPGVWISNTAPNLKIILKGTTWAARHNATLNLIDGAIKTKTGKSIRFSGPVKSAAVWIPYSAI